MNRNKFQIIKNLGQMLLNLTEAGVLNLLMILSESEESKLRAETLILINRNHNSKKIINRIIKRFMRCLSRSKQ